MAQATIRDPRDPKKRKPVELDATGRYTGGVPTGWTDYELEPAQDAQRFNTSPVNTQDEYTRDKDGYTNKLVNPLDKWKNQTGFLDTAREIINKNLSFNKDINKQQTSLEGLYRTTEPFGSTGQKAASAAAGLPSSFNDKRFRLMSPGDQTSVKNARDSAILAHMGGLEKEREFRGTRMEDTIQSIKDYHQELRLSEQDRRAEEKHNLDIKERLQKLGDYIIDESGNVVRGFTSATASQIAEAMKNVESGGNYESKGASGEYGAYQFMPATWKGWSDEYNKETNAGQSSLAQTKENQDKIATWKVQQWLDQGYNAAQIASLWNSGSPEWEGKIGTNKQGVKYNVPNHVNKVLAALGKIVPEKSGNTHELYNKAQAQKIADNAGLNFTDMWNNKTDKEISEIQKSNMNEDAIDEWIDDNLDKSFFVKYGKTKGNEDGLDEEDVKALITHWRNGISLDQLRQDVEEMGFNRELIDDLFVFTALSIE